MKHDGHIDRRELGNLDSSSSQMTGQHVLYGVVCIVLWCLGYEICFERALGIPYIV